MKLERKDRKDPIGRKYRKDLEAWRWGFDVTILGQRIRRYEWPLKRDARDALAALHTRARAIRYGLVEPEPKITLQDLFNKLSKDKSAQKREHLLPRFEEFIEVIDPQTLLRKLSRADWKLYVTEIEARELKPNTINRYLGAVSSALHMAGDYFPALSEWRPPRAPWKPESLGRNRVLAPKEISQLLAALRSPRQKFERDRGVSWRYEVYDLFRLMLLTGAREGELLNLKQTAVNWDWKTVQITATKTNTRRIIPLSDAASEIMTTRKNHAPRFFKQFSKDGLYTSLQRAGKISGLEYGDGVEGGWVIYDLRHVAATVMENAGIPYSAVSAILGHKRGDQTATYAHAQLATMRRGVEALEKHCREIDGFFQAPKYMQGHVQTLRQSAQA